jgi:DNA polymerase-3 subunit gamma/tau
VARILAKAVETNGEDVYEIDAASNRGIDDIRHLREHVSVLPFSSPYKVYIIDEVHMLSKDAWNALLKTLEEPPQHVIFILATTELNKVPETIVSRCQTFLFRRPSRDIIRAQVSMIAKKEGFALDPGAADLIALLGDGSFRDALGTLEKVIASSSPSSSFSRVGAQKQISREDVENLTGAPKAELVNKFIERVLAKDSDKVLATIGQAVESGLSMNIFVTLILEKLRFIFLLQNSPSSKVMIQARTSEDDLAFISAQAVKKTLTAQMLATLLSAAEGIGRARIESLPLELAAVDMTGVYK